MLDHNGNPRPALVTPLERALDADPLSKVVDPDHVPEPDVDGVNEIVKVPIAIQAMNLTSDDYEEMMIFDIVSVALREALDSTVRGEPEMRLVEDVDAGKITPTHYAMALTRQQLVRLVHTWNRCILDQKLAITPMDVMTPAEQN